MIIIIIITTTNTTIIIIGVMSRTARVVRGVPAYTEHRHSESLDFEF